MNKQQAIEWYLDIQSGQGIDRHTALNTLDRGWIAQNKWNDDLFVLGLEYGVMLALIKVFGITRDDLHNTLMEHYKRTNP